MAAGRPLSRIDNRMVTPPRTNFASDHAQSIPFPTSPASEPAKAERLVEIRHLRKNYGEHLAVKDVSFSLHAGEVLGLLGPNGAGKSTTMMMIAGLLTPSEGQIDFLGHRFNGRDPEQRRLLGVVPQEYAIYQDLNAIDNLLFFGKLYGLRGQQLKSRCEDVLDQIGLAESALRPSGTYSGGMKRRLNFGVALMHSPRILILDEPTVGVDPQSRSHLMDCVRRQAADGAGIIYASHYMEEVQAICQSVAIIDHGEVLAYDSIANLLAGLTADVILHVDRTTGLSEELGYLGRLSASADGEPIVVVSGEQSPVPDADVPSIPLRYGLGRLDSVDKRQQSDLAWRLLTILYKLSTLGIRVLRVETQQSNLERLFLQLTGNRLRD